MQSEKNIFLLHAGSWIGLLILGIVLLGFGPRKNTDLWSAFIFTLSVHGIYSLSFLELWSLSQISISLRLLQKIALGVSDKNILMHLPELGDDKFLRRLDSLKRLGLISPNEKKTLLGAIIAFFLRTILWLSKGRSLNQ